MASSMCSIHAATPTLGWPGSPLYPARAQRSLFPKSIGSSSPRVPFQESRLRSGSFESNLKHMGGLVMRHRTLSYIAVPRVKWPLGAAVVLFGISAWSQPGHAYRPFDGTDA